jgi:hypothetical protein
VSALAVVDTILDHYDRIAEERESSSGIRFMPPQSRQFLGEVERAMDEGVGLRRIQNLAFIARMGLRARLATCEAMGAAPGKKWEVISTASSALREILKALGALAVAVCAHERLPEPSTFYVTELSRSLAIRRAYRILHAEVDPAHEPGPSEAWRRLRRAASAIAKLVGRAIYPSMRVHDRYSLRTMQHRLASFLADTSGDAKAREAAGLRLFQDLGNLVELMLHVNDRAELRAHDARVLAEVVPALELEGAPLAPAIEALRAVYGRDLELDAMLGGEDPPTAAQLVAKLQKLQLQLAPQAPSVPAPRPSAAELGVGEDFI